LRKFNKIHDDDGKSANKLCHPRSVAYSAELVPPYKQQISGGGACFQASAEEVKIINSIIDKFDIFAAKTNYTY